MFSLDIGRSWLVLDAGLGSSLDDIRLGEICAFREQVWRATGILAENNKNPLTVDFHDHGDDTHHIVIRGQSPQPLGAARVRIMPAYSTLPHFDQWAKYASADNSAPLAWLDKIVVSEGCSQQQMIDALLERAVRVATSEGAAAILSNPDRTLIPSFEALGYVQAGSLDYIHPNPDRYRVLVFKNIVRNAVEMKESLTPLGEKYILTTSQGLTPEEFRAVRELEEATFPPSPLNRVHKDISPILSLGAGERLTLSFAELQEAQRLDPNAKYVFLTDVTEKRIIGYAHFTVAYGDLREPELRIMPPSEGPSGSRVAVISQIVMDPHYARKELNIHGVIQTASAFLLEEVFVRAQGPLNCAYVLMDIAASPVADKHAVAAAESFGMYAIYPMFRRNDGQQFARFIFNCTHPTGSLQYSLEK